MDNRSVLLNWVDRHQFTEEAATYALGLSSDVLTGYLRGAAQVPRTVALACLGWEIEQRLALA